MSKKGDSLFVVKLFDGFDFEWIDISDPLPYYKAKEIWDEKTKKGTQKTTFNDIDYYKIFPAEVVMKYSAEAENLINDCD